MVATARKLTVLCWHLVTKNQDYAFARPGLNAHKRRRLDLAAGAKHTHGRRGPGFDYNHKQFRRSERDLVEQHERAYEVMITNWRPHRLDPRWPQAWRTRRSVPWRRLRWGRCRDSRVMPAVDGIAL